MAQQLVFEPTPAPEAQCLTKVGEIEYPPEAYQRDTAGRVKVALTFSAATSAPDVEVLSTEGGASFEQAVRDYVKKFRVPCFGNNSKPARLQFDFLFQPDSRLVYWDTPADQFDVSTLSKRKCFQHPLADKGPEYPQEAARHGDAGKVIARLTFTAADQPPTIELGNSPGARRMRDSVLEWAKDYRMPCHPGTGPITLSQTFIYLSDSKPGQDDTRTTGFKPGVTLRQLLPMVKGIQEQQLDFDTTQMACPFDLDMVYLRPGLPNRVGERGDHNPARGALLKWLADVQFNMPDKEIDGIYAEKLKFSVPCLKIKLKPKEKS